MPTYYQLQKAVEENDQAFEERLQLVGQTLRALRETLWAKYSVPQEALWFATRADKESEYDNPLEAIRYNGGDGNYDLWLGITITTDGQMKYHAGVPLLLRFHSGSVDIATADNSQPSLRITSGKLSQESIDALAEEITAMIGQQIVDYGRRGGNQGAVV